MADLESALANIPGLAGYLGQEQFTQKRNAGTLENAGRAQTLQDHFAAAARERGLRQALQNIKPGSTDEEQLQAILPYVGADSAFKAIEGRKARELALQQAAAFKQMNEDRQREALRQRGVALDNKATVNEYSALPQGAAPLQRVGGALPAGPQATPVAPQQVGGDLPTFADAMSVAGPRARAGQPFTIQTDPASPQPIQQQGAGPGLAGISEAPVAAPSQPQTPVQGAPVARGESPPTQGAPVARMPDLPTPPPALEQQWAKLPRKAADTERAKWMAKQIGGTQLDEHAVKVAAWEKLLFGTDAKGMGNASSQQRAQIANERARIGKELGLTDTEMAMMPQDNKVKMKAVDKLTSWGAFVDKAAEQLIPSIDLAISYAGKLDQGTLQSLNKAILAGKTEFNNPTANAYAVAVNTVRREYGRLMSGPTSNAMLPVEAMKQGDNLISTALNVSAWNEVKNVITKDAQYTRDAVKGQINSLRGTISVPKSAQETPSTPAPSAALDFLKQNPTVPMKEAFKKKYGYLPEGM